MKIFEKILSKNKKGTDSSSQQSLTRTESLQCIPVRSSIVEWSVEEENDILLEYPITMKPFFLSLAKRFKKDEDLRLTKKLQLDLTGSTVWKMLDGNNNVKIVIKRVSADTGLPIQEAELAVTAFLRQLGRRGLIFLRQPQPKKD